MSENENDARLVQVYCKRDEIDEIDAAAKADRRPRSQFMKIASLERARKIREMNESDLPPAA